MATSSEAVASMREFNRTFVVVQGFLNRNYLGSGRSVTEARVLFEVSRREGITAAGLAEQLRLDKGYLSRMLGSLESHGLILRVPSAANAHIRTLHLTQAGTEEAERLVNLTNDSVRRLVDPLSDTERDELVDCMERMRELLERSIESREDAR